MYFHICLDDVLSVYCAFPRESRDEILLRGKGYDTLCPANSAPIKLQIIWWQFVQIQALKFNVECGFEIRIEIPI